MKHNITVNLPFKDCATCPCIELQTSNHALRDVYGVTDWEITHTCAHEWHCKRVVGHLLGEEKASELE